MDKLKGQFINVMKKIVSYVVIPIIVIMGIVLTFIKSGIVASASSGDYDSFVNLGDYIVKTDEPGAIPAMTKDQLKTAIEGGGFTDKMTQHYIDWIDYFIKIQNKNKINAAFAVAVLQNEHGGGGPGGDINWGMIPASTYNICSIKNSSGGWMQYKSFEDAIVNGFGELIPSVYFSDSLYSVEDIGKRYCPEPVEPDGTNTWGKSVRTTLSKMYSAVAETITPSSGSYSSGTYKYAGKTYTIFSQHAYAHVPYANGNIYDSGCGVTSVAICVSGYKKGETPETIAKKCEPKYGNTVNPRLGYGNPGGVFHKFLEEYGLTCDEHEGYDETTIINHLKSGNPVILNYGGTLNINAGGGYDTPGHFTTLLGINGNNIFVGDPADVSGEISLKNLKMTSNLKRYFLVSPKK